MLPAAPVTRTCRSASWPSSASGSRPATENAAVMGVSSLDRPAMRLPHRRPKRVPHVRSTAAARRNGLGEPRRLSDTDVGVAIHARVAPGPDLGDGRVDRALIPAAERRATAKDVALVVAKRWIIDVAAGDGPD